MNLTLKTYIFGWYWLKTQVRKRGVLIKCSFSYTLFTVYPQSQFWTLVLRIQTFEWDFIIQVWIFLTSPFILYILLQSVTIKLRPLEYLSVYVAVKILDYEYVPPIHEKKTIFFLFCRENKFKIKLSEEALEYLLRHLKVGKFRGKYVNHLI